MPKKPAKHKAHQHGWSKKRKALTALVLLLAVLTAVIALTEPQQLPARIADHRAVRTAYVWRDGIERRVHNFIYPLAALRDDAPAPATSGAGYTKHDRNALDDLIQDDINKAPTKAQGHTP